MPWARPRRRTRITTKDRNPRIRAVRRICAARASDNSDLVRPPGADDPSMRYTISNQVGSPVRRGTGAGSRTDALERGPSCQRVSESVPMTDLRTGKVVPTATRLRRTARRRRGTDPPAQGRRGGPHDDAGPPSHRGRPRRDPRVMGPPLPVQAAPRGRDRARRSAGGSSLRPHRRGVAAGPDPTPGCGPGGASATSMRSSSSTSCRRSCPPTWPSCVQRMRCRDSRAGPRPGRSPSSSATTSCPTSPDPGTRR